MDNPTYYNLGNHSETIQIDYDPTKISYKELLDVFWDSHNPTTPPYTQQYKSTIFYHDEKQRKTAIESKEKEEFKLGRQILTEIVSLPEFYLAKDYHQKYYLKTDWELMEDLSAIYPAPEDFIASTAVSRINGYAGGYGIQENLQAELDEYGLSDTGKNRLLQITERTLKSGCAIP